MRQRRSIPARLLAAGLLQAAAALTPMPSGAGEKPADAQPWSPPNWQVEAARVVAKRALTDQLAAALRTTLLTDRNALLSALESLAAREDLSWPQREAALLQFVQSLDDLRRDQVPPAALALLAQWQPRTLVPHEEMSTLGTPLFDIAARTHGVLNRWRREEGRRRAASLLSGDPQGFLADWSHENDPATRAGLLDALTVSDRGALQKVLAAAQAGMTDHPEFAIPARHAAVVLRDVDAITALLVHGAGSETRSLLQAAADLLSADQLVSMLAVLQRDAGAPEVALAIGVWSSKLAGHSGAESVLLDLLSDTELGSSAALALSLAPSAKTHIQLLSLASMPDTSMRARRARLALQLDQLSERPR